jgi:anaerobic ribonucleoside-triphosphate reductase activating protein
MKIQIAGKIENSMVNGKGMRFVLFMSGCKHNCLGCHNKAMQDFKYGDQWEIDELFEYIKNHSDLVSGITYSGGDPFEQSEALSILSKRIKDELNKDIWCYTGYILEDLLAMSDSKRELLKYIDVLVDGKFEQDKIDNAPRYAGSSNQRIIKLKDGRPIE